MGASAVGMTYNSSAEEHFLHVLHQGFSVSFVDEVGTVFKEEYFGVITFHVASDLLAYPGIEKGLGSIQ